MTEPEYDAALGDLTRALMKRLDTNPLRLEMSGGRRFGRPSVSIPLSHVIDEADLCNALHEAMQLLGLDLAKLDRA